MRALLLQLARLGVLWVGGSLGRQLPWGPRRSQVGSVRSPKLMFQGVLALVKQACLRQSRHDQLSIVRLVMEMGL